MERAIFIPDLDEVRPYLGWVSDELQLKKKKTDVIWTTNRELVDLRLRQKDVRYLNSPLFYFQASFCLFSSKRW